MSSRITCAEMSRETRREFADYVHRNMKYGGIVERAAMKWERMTPEERQMSPANALISITERKLAIIGKLTPYAKYCISQGIEVEDDDLTLLEKVIKVYIDSQKEPLPWFARFSGSMIGSGKLKGFFLPRSDWRGLFLGNYTDCCQHPNGAKHAAFHGQRSSHGCFFVVEDQNGRIVAQSWVWEADAGKYGLYLNTCFDNIEAKNGWKNNADIKSIYVQFAKKMAGFGRTVCVGTRFSDIDLPRLPKLKSPQFPIDWTQDEKDDSDAHSQVVLAKPQPIRRKRIKTARTTV